MFVSTDPRSRLAQQPAGKAAQPEAFGTPSFGRFYESPPRIDEGGTKSWFTRGENFLCAYSEAQSGATFPRQSQSDEYGLLLPDREVEVEIEWGGTRTRVSGYSVAFIPPGDSVIHVKGDGRVVRFFTTRSADLVELCQSDYVPDPNVAPLQLWPEPSDGFRVRAYSLDVAPQEGRFGRIFRCTTMMINFLDPRHGRRDPTKMSPHSHADYQQCSLCLEGSFTHHLRWPWLSDKNKWREDRHEVCHAPSVAFIPAQVIHTAESVDPGKNQLVDIFAPPRLDFSRQEGWVLNAGEYPMPSET